MPSSPSQSAAILLAGGSGARMQGQIPDKSLATIAGKALVRYSIDAFVASGAVQTLVIVYRDEAQKRLLQTQTLDLGLKALWTPGGAERQDSVLAGLRILPDDTGIVLIHDCARPCVTPEAIRESARQAANIGAACLARRVTDTIKSASPYGAPQEQPEPRIQHPPPLYLPTTVERSKLWAMETPQSFRYALIREAYETVARSGAKITDDLSAIEDLDQPVAFIENDRPNPKLTTPADLDYLAYLLTPR